MKFLQNLLTEIKGIKNSVSRPQPFSPAPVPFMLFVIDVVHTENTKRDSDTLNVSDITPICELITELDFITDFDLITKFWRFP